MLYTFAPSAEAFALTDPIEEIKKRKLPIEPPICYFCDLFRGGLPLRGRLRLSCLHDVSDYRIAFRAFLGLVVHAAFTLAPCYARLRQRFQVNYRKIYSELGLFLLTHS